MSFNSSCLFVEQVNEINNNSNNNNDNDNDNKSNNEANTIATTESNNETKPVELHPNDVTHSEEKLELFQANAACLLVDLLLPNNIESKQEQNESNIADNEDKTNKSEQKSSQQRTNAKSCAEINTFTGFEASEESHPSNQHPHQTENSTAEVFTQSSARRTNEEIPLYRLRTESVHTYKNSNWIKAPSKYLLDQQLTNEQIKFTLDYFSNF